MYRRAFVIVSATLAGIIVLGLAFTRWNGPEIRRPLQCDELTTLEYYTWAGLASSGEPHRLRRVDDYLTLPPVKGRQLGMGIYRSLGVWTDTNNHVLHSLLVNWAIAAGNPDERTVRIPALLGAIAASFLAFWVCHQVFGWRVAAPLASVAIFCLPYMVQYSQEARGYTWMVVLVFLQLGSMYRLAHRPDSIVWGAVCAFIAILTYMNLVTLALDWLFPLYLALWIFPPLPSGGQPFSPEKLRAWRCNLLVQMLAFGSVGLVFLIDRLPAVYSTMYHYGDSFTGFAEYFQLLARIMDYLFPGLVWKTLAVLGLAGVLMMLINPSHRPLGMVALFTLAITLTHYWVVGKFPPERSCGFLPPLALLGTAYLVEKVLARIQSAGWWYALYGSVSAVMVGLALLSLNCRVLSDERIVGIPRLIADQEGLAQKRSYFVLPSGEGWNALRIRLPDGWIDPYDPLPDNGEVTLVCCLAGDGEPRLLMDEGVAERNIWRCFDHPPKHQTVPASGCRLAWQRMRVKPLSPETETSLILPSLIIWRPSPDHLGLDGSPVREHIARFKLFYLQRTARVPAKLAFFSRLSAVEFLPQSTAEAETTMVAVKEGLKRFGGSAWLLQPLAESGE